MERNNIKPTPEREEIRITAVSGETITAYRFIKPDQEPTGSIYLFFEHDGLYYSMRVRDSIDEVKEYCGLLLSSANK